LKAFVINSYEDFDLSDFIKKNRIIKIFLARTLNHVLDMLIGIRWRWWVVNWILKL